MSDTPPRQRAQKGMGSVFQTTKNGQPTWVACVSGYTEEGKRWFVRGYGGTRQQAIERKNKNLQKRLTKGGGQVMLTPVAAGPTLKVFVDRWLAHYTPESLGRETRRKYESDLAHWVLPYLGDKRLDQLTVPVLHEHFHQVVYKQATASARWNAYKTLSTCLNWGVKHEYLDRNPLTRVDAPKRETKVREADEKYITKRANIIRGLLAYVSEPANRHHDVFGVLAFMALGLRKSEVLGMEWNCVTNLEKKNACALTVKQQLHRATGEGWFIEPRTKTRTNRRIELPDEWRKVLLAERAKQRTAADPKFSDLIFLRPDGQHYSYTHLQQRYEDALRDYINLSGRPFERETDYFRPHFWRHACVTLLFQAGVPEQRAMAISGHASSDVHRIYLHLDREGNRDATKLLGAKLFRTPEV